MNSTTNSGDLLGFVNINGEFNSGIGSVYIGIFLLIETIAIASSCYCTRKQTTSNAPVHRNQNMQEEFDTQRQYVVVDVGLDESTLQSYPKLLYSKAKVKNKDSTATCCSICLADYKNSDTLRLLPDCGHLFHLKCVDPWLRLHSTCPVCRTSPMPTPMSTPLVVVVPLAARSFG